MSQLLLKLMSIVVLFLVFHFLTAVIVLAHVKTEPAVAPRRYWLEP